MTKLVVGNLKMSMTFENIKEYVPKIRNLHNQNVVICPTSLYIPYFLKQDFQVGIQNIFYEKQGSFTGEISPLQAKSVGVNYCLIGHSERRKYLHETDLEINQKIKQALTCGLNVILCIGETLEEKSMLRTDMALKSQLFSDLSGINLKNIVIAYEPVWAIGTNQIPKKEELEHAVSFIKEIVRTYMNYEVPVLYGGSINDTNIAFFKTIASLDGYLIGGASTNADIFMKIVEVAQS